jgi:arsenate reductase
MATLTIYHNPQCSKSRNALEFLEKNKEKYNYDIQVVLYKKEPLTRQQLQILVQSLDLPQDQYTRLLRPEAQSLAKSMDEAIDLIIQDPARLERPFIIDNQRKKAALGRPDLTDVEKLVASL